MNGKLTQGSKSYCWLLKCFIPFPYMFSKWDTCVQDKRRVTGICPAERFICSAQSYSRRNQPGTLSTELWVTDVFPQDSTSFRAKLFCLSFRARFSLIPGISPGRYGYFWNCNGNIQDKLVDFNSFRSAFKTKGIKGVHLLRMIIKGSWGKGQRPQC